MRCSLRIFCVFIAILLLSSCGELHYLDGAMDAEVEENNILPTDFSYKPGEDRPLTPTPENGYICVDDYLYYYGNGTVHRYNTRTGVRTNLCEDPLCEHKDENCVFGNYDDYLYYDGYWYLANRGTEKDRSPYLYYSRYDMATGEERLLVRNMGGLQNRNVSLLVHDGYLYYYEVTEKETATDQYNSTLCRIQTDGKGTENEKILTFDSHMSDLMLFAEGDKLYFCAFGEGLYYIKIDGADGYQKHALYTAQDERFGKLMHGAAIRNGSIYICEWLGKDSYFYCIDPDGRKTPLATIPGGAVDCYFTEQYMYFRVQEYKVIGKGDDGSGHGLVDIKIRLPSIYRVDYSGNVTQILHDFEDERYRSCSIDRMTVVGNYIYAQYAH